jgi:protein TonB
MITEWNIKRILLTMVGVVLFIVVLFFLFKPDTQNTDLQPITLINMPVKKAPEKTDFLAKENQSDAGKETQKIVPVETMPKVAQKIITQPKAEKKVVTAGKTAVASRPEKSPHITAESLQQQIAQLGSSSTSFDTGVANQPNKPVKTKKTIQEAESSKQKSTHKPHLEADTVVATPKKTAKKTERSTTTQTAKVKPLTTVTVNKTEKSSSEFSHLYIQAGMANTIIAENVNPVIKETNFKKAKHITKVTSAKKVKPLVKEATYKATKPLTKVSLTKNTKLSADEKITTTDKNDSATQYYRYPTTPN